MLPQLRPAPDLRWDAVDDELIIFDQNSGQYHVLNGVAAHVWQGLSAGQQGDALIDELMKSFDANRETMCADVAEFLAQMREKQLLVEVTTA
jgi:PqqD family protein of HPr-rel-A system